MRGLIITGVFLMVLTSCGTTLYYTPCQRNTEVERQYAEQDGVAWRIGHGWYKGKPHRWLERLEGGVWLMARDTGGYVSGGWRVEEYGGYEVGWYQYGNPRWVTKGVEDETRR